MNRRHVIRSLVAAVVASFGPHRARAEEIAPGGVQAIDGVAWMPVHCEEFTGIAGEPLAESVLIPMPDRQPGVAYCPRCDGLPVFDIPWQGADHVAVRLWDRSDVGQTLAALQMPTRIVIDGEPVEWGLEAYAGPHGWAVLELDADCPNCRGGLRVLRVGNVVLSQPRRERMIAAMGQAFVDGLEASILERS